MLGASLRLFRQLCRSVCLEKSVDSRWVLTWIMVRGVKTAKARLVAIGFQVPDILMGLVDSSGCASLRPSHLQVISPSILKNGVYGALISICFFASRTPAT